MLEDPGYVPKLGSRAQQKAVIDELLSLWKFDDQNFCVTCMVRRPLRSKHCRRCSRCVAKHDQWVSLKRDCHKTLLTGEVIALGYIAALAQTISDTSSYM